MDAGTAEHRSHAPRQAKLVAAVLCPNDGRPTTGTRKHHHPGWTASYWATTSAEIRPRGDTAMPWAAAHSRTAAELGPVRGTGRFRFRADAERSALTRLPCSTNSVNAFRKVPAFFLLRSIS